MSLQVEAGGAAAIEHMDLRRVADAEEGALERHRIADLQGADLIGVNRHFKDVVGHGGAPDQLKAMPPGVRVARARRAEWHWMFTATGFWVMWVAATST